MTVASIHITLFKDRTKAGVLDVFDVGGVRIFSAPCLGLATGHPKLNPLRHPLRRWGNTPVGDYKRTMVIDRGPKFASVAPYGRYVIRLSPLDPATARNRHGLMIHAGRGNAKLMATRGCVRLLDIDMARLARLCSDAVFKVSIGEQAAARDEKFESVLAYLRGLPRARLKQLFELVK
jgi:hypothetical protein